MANENYKKQMEALDKHDKQSSRLKKELQSKCTHTRNGEVDIVKAHDRKPGELKFICRQCRKVINLTKFDDSVLEEACEIIDRACDVIKITLDDRRDEDALILKRVAKTQFRVCNEIPQYHAAVLKKSRQGNRGKGNNNNNNNSGGGFNKPIIG